MIKILWDEGFKRKYKKVIKYNEILKTKFWDALKIFVYEPNTPILKTHKLYGKLKGLHAFSIDYNFRVIFKFISNIEVLLIDIGTHEEVY